MTLKSSWNDLAELGEWVWTRCSCVLFGFTHKTKTEGDLQGTSWSASRVIDFLHACLTLNVFCCWDSTVAVIKIPKAWSYLRAQWTFYWIQTDLLSAGLQQVAQMFDQLCECWPVCGTIQPAVQHGLVSMNTRKFDQVGVSKIFVLLKVETH